MKLTNNFFEVTMYPFNSKTSQNLVLVGRDLVDNESYYNVLTDPLIFLVFKHFAEQDSVDNEILEIFFKHAQKGVLIPRNDE